MKLRSDNVTKGSERAPNRSLFYAMGYTKEELERLYTMKYLGFCVCQLLVFYFFICYHIKS